MLDQFTWLRDWMIFSFFMDMPPMHPQNANLEILDQVETIGSRRHNGVLFYSNMVRLQLVTFKNSRYVGEKMVLVPSTLEKKLRSYVKLIHPAFGMYLKLNVIVNLHKQIASKTLQLITRDSDEDTNEEDSDECEDEEVADTHEDTSSRKPLVADVLTWRQQSPWLFLSWGNQQLKRPGTIWIQFLEQQCGKRISIGIWRKVVETQS